MAKKPTTIDEYLATASPEQRRTLEKLRKTIRAAAPQAEEYINYGVAAFHIGGKALVGFGASAKHCSFYPMDGQTTAEFKEDLADFEISKGSIRFDTDNPLPAALVRKLVKARLAKLGAASSAKKPVAK